MSVSVTLRGKTAIVAGGGRGIGASVCEYLADADANVVVVDKVHERAVETSERICARGGLAIPIVADLLSRSDIANIVQRTQARFGGIDILANVAGGMWAYVPYRRMHEITDDEWDFVLGLNLKYVFMLSSEVIAVMLQQGRGGSIVNIGSIAGIFSSPNSSPYGAAKAGIVSLTRTLAQEYGRDGIRVNTVAPGRIETPAAPSETLGPGGSYLETVPMGFVGKPIDVAKAVMFLASDLASYVTGQTILVDGGASTTSAIMAADGAQLVTSDVVRGRP